MVSCIFLCYGVAQLLELRPVVFRDVSEGVVQKLMQLKQALDQGDFNQASSIQVSCA